MRERHFHALRITSIGFQLPLSVTLVVLTAIVGLGIGRATTGMWLPMMQEMRLR